MLIIFGGSFDPVHIGHLLIARDIFETFKPESFLFIPAYRAPLKEGHRASPDDRLTMLRLALEGEDYQIDDTEIRRGGTSYTVDTLREFRAEKGQRPWLLIGSDTALSLHRWKEPEEVVRLARLLIVDRSGKLPEVRKYLKERFPDLKEGEDLSFAEVRRIDISASEIRKRVSQGNSIRYMVPEKVEEYIRENGLYRKL